MNENERLLKERALKSLYNGVEINDDVVKKAIKDADDITQGRKVIHFFYEDFAYIRLKIYLKIEISEEDEMLLKACIKHFENAPFLDANGLIDSAKITKAANRKNYL